MTDTDVDLQHPLLRFATAVSEALDRVSALEPAFLPAEQKRAALLTLAQDSERITALRVQLQGCAEEVADAVGARDVGDVLAHELHRDRRRMHRDQALAEALTLRWTRTASAWRQGRVNGEQAAVIADALDQLHAHARSWITHDQLIEAEEHLITEAANFDPHGLKVLGRRLFEVICPDQADEQEQLALQRAEADARAAARLKLMPMGDGSVRISGRVPDATARRLATLLDAHTAPRRDHLSGDVRDAATGERLPADRLRGQAFCTLVEHADPDKLPRHGQTATTLFVTMDFHKLRAGVGAGALLDGTPLSVGDVRRLACNAELIPAVLGGPSEVLDLGRASRLFQPPQRKALALRDLHCRAQGCTVPASFCEAHHLHPWSTGGRTDLADGVLLCSFHHHRIHDDRYHHERAPDGSFRFHCRT